MASLDLADLPGVQTPYASSLPFLDYASSLPPLGRGVPGEGEELDLTVLLAELYKLAKSRGTSNRVFIPLLFTLSSLTETGCLDAVALDPIGSQLLFQSLSIACYRLSTTKNTSRASASLKLYGHLGLARRRLAADIVSLAAGSWHSSDSLRSLALRASRRNWVERRLDGADT